MGPFFENSCERIQRNFPKFASFCLKIDHQPHDYSPILLHLQLSSLSERRVLVNIDLLNKLVNGSINAPELLQRWTLELRADRPG